MKTILDNGIKIITHHMQSNSMTIGIWIHSGLIYEKPECAGISHFIEHMLFKGSDKYSYRQIKELIEGEGGDLNAFTGFDITCFFVKIPVSRFLKIFPVLMEMVFNPAFRESDFVKEKNVIIEELHMYKDNPDTHVSEMVEEIMWPDHILGNNIAGSIETVSSMTLEQLKTYYNEKYVSSNILVSSAGNFEHIDIVNLLSGVSVRQGSFDRYVKALSYAPSAVIREVRDTDQTHVVVGVESVPFTHQYTYAQDLLSVILGGNMSSRLFNIVREERGLVYRINTSADQLANTGLFEIFTALPHDKIEDVFGLIIKEIDDIRANSVFENELVRAKNYLSGTMLMDLDGTKNQMMTSSYYDIYENKKFILQDVLDKIDSVTVEDIKKVANLIFKDYKVAMLGPTVDKIKLSIER